ncbi:MAG: sulfite exporter TauE/SafE family protein, partial [Rhodospirillaceae bacterium]|nr:sulfite exporter TauE/SafE family protein [Rhodospirillaceae bacterium]
ILSMLVIAAGFAVGGLAKGTFGLGMPFLALPILVTVLPYQTAVALMLVPSFTANFQQAVRKGIWRHTLRRYKWLLIPMLVVIPLMVQILIQIEQETGLLILGLISLTFVATQILPVQPVIKAARERVLNPIVGIAAGALCGVSGLYGPVLIVYLLALRIPKDEFVSALALMYFLGSFALYGSLAAASILTLDVAAVSAIGAVIIGLMILIGQKIRERLDEERFRRLILVLLFIVGCDLLRRALT